MLSGRLITLVGGVLLLCSMASAQIFTSTAFKRRVMVPEPSVLALAGAGVVGIAGAIWRKTRK